MKKQYIYPAVTVSRVALTQMMANSLGLKDEKVTDVWVREEEQLPEWNLSNGQEEW